MTAPQTGLPASFGDRLALLLGRAWTAVSAELAVPVPVELTGPGGLLPSSFPAADAAAACISAALVAASLLHESRGGDRLPAGLDRGHVAAAVRSERFFRLGGQPARASRRCPGSSWPRTDGSEPTPTIPGTGRHCCGP